MIWNENVASLAPESSACYAWRGTIMRGWSLDSFFLWGMRVDWDALSRGDASSWCGWREGGEGRGGLSWLASVRRADWLRTTVMSGESGDGAGQVEQILL